MTKIKANQLEIVEILNDPLAQATETRNGTLEIATQIEADAGSDTIRAITSNTLANFVGFHNWIDGNNGVDFLNPANSDGNNSQNLAIGSNAQATGVTHGIAIGSSANCDATESIVIGHSAGATYSNAIAIGRSAATTATPTIAIGDVAQATLTGQISIGTSTVAGTVSPTDVPYSVKIGYGTADTNKNMLHLFSKGKLELYGEEAQFIFPNYESGGVGLPVTNIEGGAVWDSTTKEFKIYNGSVFSAIGPAKNWLTAHSGDGFATAPTALFSNAIALGNNASSAAAESIAIGTNVTASVNSVSLGINSDTLGSSSIAIGSGAQSGTGAEGATIAIGLNSSSVLGSQVSLGNGVTGLTVTPTDVQFSTKIGYGVTGVDKNMLHLFSKGKLELYGDEAQFIMPNYSVTGSPIDVPAIGIEGGLIYDDIAKELQLYDGTSWSAVGGGLTNPLIDDLDVSTFLVKASDTTYLDLDDTATTLAAAGTLGINSVGNTTIKPTTKAGTGGFTIIEGGDSSTGAGGTLQIIGGTGVGSQGGDITMIPGFGSSRGVVTVDGDVEAVGNVISHIGLTDDATTERTLILADDGELISMTSSSANFVIVPLTSSVSFPIGTQILIEQEGTGQTTIVGEGSPPAVTLNSAGGLLSLANQYSMLTLIKKGTDTWTVAGDLA